MQKTVLIHDGKKIALSEAREEEGPDARLYMDITPGKEEKDFPLAGCRTVSLEMYTGGASCCVAYFILSSCGEEDSAAFLHSSKVALGDPMVLDQAKGLKGYGVADNAFTYYSAAGRDEEHSISLSGADSPLPTRYIVFDGGSWRVDKAGEFKELYEKELNQVRADGEWDPVAKTILVGYYSFMLGEDPARIRQEVGETLSPAYADLADKIFADIESGVKKMSQEVENLALK